MSADPPITPQLPDDSQQISSKAYALSGRIMLTSIITLFIIVFFLVLLHLYARWYLTRLNRRSNPPYRIPRVIYYVDHTNNNTGSTGLDASVLKLLPLFVYGTQTDVNKLECAVCLSEFEHGDTGRVLPNCKHRFHTGCIDMWFGSHSTCPLCRSPVEPPFEPVETDINRIIESGSSMETTSLGERRKRVDVRIDVPVNTELVGELPSQGFRSPGSRLLSFKRIMNMNRVSPVVSPSSGVGPSFESVGAESGVELARQDLETESSQAGR